VLATVHFDRLLGWHGACKVAPSILQVSMLNKSGEMKGYMADVKGWPGQRKSGAFVAEGKLLQYKRNREAHH
jgi:hypothetical protein